MFACQKCSATTATASSSGTTASTPRRLSTSARLAMLSDLAAEHRRLPDRGVHHVRHAHVDAEHRPAAHLVREIEARDRLADQAELVGGLERRLGRRRERRGRRGELAVARDLALRAMHHPAARGVALRDRHAPALGRRQLQHLARRRTGLAQRLHEPRTLVLPPVPCMWNAGFWYASTGAISIRTFCQSHSSSSARIIGSEVYTP